MIFNVGIDFGTSATKAAFFDLQLEKRHYMVFDDNEEGLKRYILPSTMKISTDGRVYFAIDKSGIYPSDKYFELFKLGMERSYEKFEIAGTIVKLHGYQIVALYCSHVLSLIRKVLKRNFNNPDLIFQFGVPIDHLGINGSLREKKFKEAFNLAEIISQSKFIDNNISIETFLKVLRKAELELKNLPEEEWKVAIYPETIAGIATLLKSGELPSNKRYSIVDIGAGTTDVSYFEFNRPNQAGRFHVYHSKTNDLGDKNLFKNFGCSKTELKKSYEKGWREAYCLCEEKWSDSFSLLFLGGGSRGELRQFKNNMEFEIRQTGGVFSNFIKPSILERFPRPKDIKDSIDVEEFSWKENFDILSIAYGLSTPAPQMPTYNPQVPNRIREKLPQSPDEPLTPDVG